MSPKRPIYWLFSDWILSGVCSVVEDLIAGLPEFDHQLVFMRGEHELTVRPPPINSTFLRGFHAAQSHLAKSLPGVLVNNFDWLSLLLDRRVLARHAFVDIVHSPDGYYRVQSEHSRDAWDATVTVSQLIARSIAPLRSACVVIPNGVAPSKLNRVRLHSPPRVLYAGRLDQHDKNVRAIPEVLAGLPVEMHFAGTGEEEAYLRSAMPSAHFHGHLSRPALARLYSDCEFVILTSHFEGCPLSLLEGCHAGCIPVVGDLDSDLVVYLKQHQLGVIGPLTQLRALLGSFLGKDLQAHSAAVQATVASSPFNRDRMLDSYRTLFSTVRAGSAKNLSFRQRLGLLAGLHRIGRLRERKRLFLEYLRNRCVSPSAPSLTI